MDESQLVKGCLRGNPAAQRELYDQFAESMLGICYRYTKSLKDAEDVLQEGFVKVYRHLHQFKFKGELGAWIRRIMVTSSLNYLKKNRRYREELSFGEEILHPVSDDNPEIRLNVKE